MTKLPWNKEKSPSTKQSISVDHKDEDKKNDLKVKHTSLSTKSGTTIPWHCHSNEIRSFDFTRCDLKMLPVERK